MIGKNGEALSAPATPMNGNEAVEEAEEEEEMGRPSRRLRLLKRQHGDGRSNRRGCDGQNFVEKSLHCAIQ